MSLNTAPTLAFPHGLGGMLNVKDFGAKGDGATDDTTAFNNAITAASAARAAPFGVAYVLVPNGQYRLTNLAIPTGIRLVGNGALLYPMATATGAMITFTGNDAAIENFYLAGGAYTGNSAITVNASCYRNKILHNRFDNWDGRAIYDQGLATVVAFNFGQNCLLGANSLAGMTGVVELAGTDAYVYNNEFTASRYSSRGQSTNGYACALAVTGANNMVHSYIAETSDVGVYVGSGATQSQFVGVRAELNYRHGWDIRGGGGEMVACHALRNSQAGSFSYDGFNISQPCQFTGRALYSESGGSSPTQNHGLYDSGNSQSVFGTWDIKSVGDNIPRGSSNSGAAGFVFMENAIATLQVGSTTPDGNLRNYKTANTGAVTVTNVTHTVNGQKLLIKGDGFTTFASNANIATLSGSNLLLASGTWYEFIVIAGVLTQVR